MLIARSVSKCLGTDYKERLVYGQELINLSCIINAFLFRKFYNAYSRAMWRFITYVVGRKKYYAERTRLLKRHAIEQRFIFFFAPETTP
jgi:hypothetical protein